MVNPCGFLSLPSEILIQIPIFLNNIEDLTNLSSTCRLLRSHMSVMDANMILRLAAAQSRVFFRPSPHFLVAATARQLGNWARESDANEAQLALCAQEGVQGLLSLALDHCGLSMERIRTLHSMRFSTMNPVTDIIDKCVGEQWYSTPNFWNGGVDDAYTISAEPSETLFHLAIYGELFAPDLEAYLNGDTKTRMLKVETRLEFAKYCIPDFACQCGNSYGQEVDPRRAVKPVGPYSKGAQPTNTNNLALTWLLMSSRWRPHWKAIRSQAGPEFQKGFTDGWWYVEDDRRDWRQRLWENVMVCQGLDGLRMIAPDLDQIEKEEWLATIKDWRDKIEKLPSEAEPVMVERQATHRWPYLLGDLRICASGYVAGT